MNAAITADRAARIREGKAATASLHALLMDACRTSNCGINPLTIRTDEIGAVSALSELRMRREMKLLDAMGADAPDQPVWMWDVARGTILAGGTPETGTPEFEEIEDDGGMIERARY